MRLLKISVPVVAIALAAIYACDGDTTAGAQFGGGGAASEADPNSGIATQAAPNTATQPAPNTATQPAPNTATEPAPNTATQPATNTATEAGPSGGSSGRQCTIACNHLVPMGCLSQEECSQFCTIVAEATGPCPIQVQSLMGCAMAAPNCDALEACGKQSDALETCVEGGTDTPVPTPTGGPTISNPADCNTSTQCGGCTSTCDICICSGQLQSATPAQITAGCASLC